MQYLTNLNFNVPELFLSLTILGQLLFGSFLAYNKDHKYPTILKDASMHAQLIGIILVALYIIQLLAVKDSLGLFDTGVVFSKLIVSLVSLGILVFLKDALMIQKIAQFEYYFFYNLALLSLLLMLNVNDLLLFYLTMEAQTLCFYILASAKRTNIFSVEAALKYFIAGSFFSAIYLLGTAIIYGSLGTINFGEILALLSFELIDYSNELHVLVLLGIVLITSTFLFKLSCAPFHFWMPDVYEGAPIGSTIVFSILPKYSTIFMLSKWLTSIGIFQLYIKDVLIFFGVLSCIIGTFYAIKQLRIKRMMLYSSIAQIGFIVASIGLHTLDGYASAFFFTVIYIASSLLFWGLLVLVYSTQLLAGNVFDEEIESIHIDKFANLISYNYLWIVILSVTFFSIAGIPPFVGFISKLLVLKELVLDTYYISAIALIVVSSVSVFYYIRILKIAFFDNKVNNPSYTWHFNSILKVHFDNLFFKFFFLLILTSLLLLLFFYPNALFTACEYVVNSSFKG